MFIKQQMNFSPALHTNKTKRFSFKSGCAVRVENGKMHWQLKPKKAILTLYIAEKEVLAVLHL